jgi:hypothetical protein
LGGPAWTRIGGELKGVVDVRDFRKKRVPDESQVAMVRLDSGNAYSIRRTKIEQTNSVSPAHGLPGVST